MHLARTGTTERRGVELRAGEDRVHALDRALLQPRDRRRLTPEEEAQRPARDLRQPLDDLRLHVVRVHHRAGPRCERPGVGEQLGGVDVVEVDEIDGPLRQEMAEGRAEVPARVPGVAHGPSAEDAAGLGQGPARGSPRLPGSHHPAPELGTQPPCIAPRKLRGEDRHLVRGVERTEELERTERAPGVGGKRDPWNNVENFHRKGLRFLTAAAKPAFHRSPRQGGPR